ncbi:MAG: LemA family protein [Bacillota bacterium]
MEKFILPGILIFIAAFIVYTYNRLVGLRNMADTAWANIDTLLQKRFDLVPNLVNTVKGYMEHEREVMENITRARTAWLNAQTIQESAGADQAAAGALKTLFAVAENYPQLKANENFLLLQEELTGLENKLAYSRQRYNRTVMVFNMVIQRVPTNLIARLFRFVHYQYFAVESDQARQVPGIDLQGGERR